MPSIACKLNEDAAVGARRQRKQELELMDRAQHHFQDPRCGWGPPCQEQEKDAVKGTKILSYFLSPAVCLSTFHIILFTC